MATTRWSADFASETRIIPGNGRHDENRLTITVIFTTRESTLMALKQAAEMAHGLGAAIRILVPQIVPYPLPLKSPQIDLGFTNRHLQTLFHEEAIDTRVEIFLCRDLADCLAQGIPERSVVLMGGRKRWWPTREMKLVRALVKRGHDALLVSGCAKAGE